MAILGATAGRRVAGPVRGCEACLTWALLHTVRVAVHDFCGRLMRRDRLIALLALAAGVGAVLLVLGSDRERSPAAASRRSRSSSAGRISGVA